MYPYIKRFLDFTVALLMLIVTLPAFLIIAVAIRLNSPGPALFRQERSGLHRKHFMIYKFRTMRIDAPKNKATHLLKNSKKHITPVGRFLRKTSLDELPQLLNIIRGEMSFVGPRPVVYTEFNLIDERDKYGANDVLPGLTGLAQVNGRDKLNYREKAYYDGEYVRHITFMTDLKIILATFSSVFRGRDIVEGRQPDRRGA